MSIEVRCPGCHREEEWPVGETGEVVVRLPGGHRRPKEHLVLAAWKTVHRAAGDPYQTVVGRCPACDQPLVSSSSEAPTFAYVFDLQPGQLVVEGETIHGPAGTMSLDDADRWVREHLPPASESGAGSLAFTTVALGIAGTLLGCWVLGIVFLGWFFWFGARTGELFAR
ncbi:MAG: hypothetical protein JRI25_07120 [Deltaproteobacteria bacterium]|nr:hypothetical protein [Deltaproteobacteria bacterium]MBW2254351.1 hypothetical protein [Deltaproteobacteria bacterium]